MIDIQIQQDGREETVGVLTEDLQLVVVPGELLPGAECPGVPLLTLALCSPAELCPAVLSLPESILSPGGENSPPGYSIQVDCHSP